MISFIIYDLTWIYRPYPNFKSPPDHTPGLDDPGKFCRSIGFDTTCRMDTLMPIKHEIPFVSAFEAEGRNLNGVSHRNSFGRLVLPSVSVSGEITGTNENPSFNLDQIPVNTWQGNLLLNWRAIAICYQEMM